MSVQHGWQLKMSPVSKKEDKPRGIIMTHHRFIALCNKNKYPADVQYPADDQSGFVWAISYVLTLSVCIN